MQETVVTAFIYPQVGAQQQRPHGALMILFSHRCAPYDDEPVLALCVSAAWRLQGAQSVFGSQRGRT